MVTTTSLNAFDYGLTAGSTSDQSTILKTAIDAAASDRKPLFIPPGTYRIQEVIIDAPVEVYSQRGQATFIPFSASNACRLTVRPTSGRLGPVTIRGINIDGQSATFPGTVPFPGLINAAACDKLLIEGCTVINSSKAGIYVNDTGGLIRANEVNSHFDYGIFSNNATSLAVADNELNYNLNNSIAIWRDTPGADTTLVHGNRIVGTDNSSGGTGQYGNAISGFRAYHLVIAENFIVNSNFSAIRLSSCSYCQVLDNQCYGSIETAIYLEAPDPTTIYQGGIISGNEILTCGTGVSVTNIDNGGRRVVVANNQITDCNDNTITYPGGSYQTHGSGITGEGDVLIVNNMIEDAVGFGIAVFPTNPNQTILGTQKIIARVADNILKACTGGIALVNTDTTYGRIFVSGNMVTEYSTSGGVSGAIVPATYNGATTEFARSGTADFGNDLTNPSPGTYPNIVLMRSYSFN